MSMLLDRWRANRDRFRLAGEIAIARTHSAGVSTYYRDAAAGGLVRHDPDGRRWLVDASGVSLGDQPISTTDFPNSAKAAPTLRR